MGRHQTEQYQMEQHQVDTERLRLRPAAYDDLDALHRIWTHPDVRRYLLADTLVARAWSRAEIENSRKNFARHGFGLWTLALHGSPETIGFCGFRYFHEPPELQLLYGLLPAYWHRGLATEAVRALISYGFDVCGFERVTASADAPNEASLRVMERVGMTFQKSTLVREVPTVYYAIERKAHQEECTSRKGRPVSSRPSG